VFERGVGETRSCGTGACAAAYAALAAEGRADGTVVVDVPGGRLSVQISSSTTVLTGPAVIVSVGVLCPEWLAD
jgi:diaminopimelate epimerase